MKTKNIKVVYSNRVNSRSVTAYPKIQMEGRWLEELGFSIGTRLVVEYEEGSIRIRPFTEEEMAACREQELLEELERKRAEYEAMQHDLAARLEELPRVAEPSTTYSTQSKTTSRKK